MAETTNYKLEKYDAGSSANLLDQYNSSMDKVDSVLKQINTKADQALNKNALPDGLAAFCTALGISSTNAATLGATLNHILNKIGTESFTVTDLAQAKKTAEGFIIPGKNA